MFETSIIKCIFVGVSSSRLFQHGCRAGQKGSVNEAVTELRKSNGIFSNVSSFNFYLKQLKSLGIIGIVTKMSIAGNSKWKDEKQMKLGGQTQ